MKVILLIIAIWLLVLKDVVLKLVKKTFILLRMVHNIVQMLENVNTNYKYQMIGMNVIVLVKSVNK